MPARPAVAVDLDEARLPRTVVSLAWPAMVEEMGFSLLGIVDTILVGQLIGSDALAAVGLGGLLFWLPMSGSMAIAVGTTAVVARDTGAGNAEGARQALRDAMALGLAWGLFMAAAMALLAGPSMHLMGAEPDVVPLGTTYILSIAPTAALLAVIFSGSAALRGAGDTRTPMVIALIANAINMVLDYALITGFLWLPEMGVLGAGLAFSLANAVGALMVLAILARGRGYLCYGPSDVLRVSGLGLRRVLVVGLPAGVEQVQFQIAFMIYARVIAGLGTASYAAHTVALRAESLAIMPGFALGIAAATLVGQALGAGRVRSAERAARLTLVYSLIIMVSMGAVLFAFAPWVTRIFTSDPEVVDIGADLLRIFAFALPGLGISASLAGGLRGAGDTRAVMLIYTVSAWLLRIPLAFLLAVPLGLGAQGAWLGSVADNSVRGSAIWWHFRRGHWKEIRV